MLSLADGLSTLFLPDSMLASDALFNRNVGPFTCGLPVHYCCKNMCMASLSSAHNLSYDLQYITFLIHVTSEPSGERISRDTLGAMAPCCYNYAGDPCNGENLHAVSSTVDL